ncbi:MAG: hypothetical protein J5I98_07665 [Phaeodactylibacter sp.]|nr:hypothetical protein [Phaeodactylibacter sp.]
MKVLEQDWNAKTGYVKAYYFVQRFSVVTNLKRENIFIRDGQSFLQYKSVKTGQEATSPLPKRRWTSWRSTTTA